MTWAAISFPICYVAVGIWRGWPILDEQLPLGIFAILVAALLVYKHRSNIRRLMEGTEPHYHPRSSRDHQRRLPRDGHPSTEPSADPGCAPDLSLTGAGF